MAAMQILLVPGFRLSPGQTNPDRLLCQVSEARGLLLLAARTTPLP